MSDDTAEKIPGDDVLRMAVDIVAAYVSRNETATDQIPRIIHTVVGSLKGMGETTGTSGAEPQKPAVPVRRSVTPEHLICLEDGRKLKMLKRHLRTTYNMTPEEYRAKWKLAPDYPMVAPNYAKQRSEFAKKIGLGRKAAAKPKRQGRTRK